MKSVISSDLLPAEAHVLALAQHKGVLRARDLNDYGWARTYLRRLCDRGLLKSVGRGLYIPAEAAIGEHQTLIEVARRVPNSVVCLLSALRFHEIGTQEPPAVWLAIPTGTRVPQIDYPLLEIARQSGAAWSEGIEEHDLAVGATTVPVRITSPAKTVADCFKFRSRVGMDVALEALREVLRQRRVTVDELWYYATVDRVAGVLRPYLEAILAR